MWSCYNEVRDKDRGIFAFTQYFFFKLWVCVLYMLLWLFANMFLIMFYAIIELNFGVRLIHSRTR